MNRSEPKKVGKYYYVTYTDPKTAEDVFEIKEFGKSTRNTPIVKIDNKSVEESLKFVAERMSEVKELNPLIYSHYCSTRYFLKSIKLWTDIVLRHLRTGTTTKDKDIAYVHLTLQTMTKVSNFLASVFKYQPLLTEQTTPEWEEYEKRRHILGNYLFNACNRILSTQDEYSLRQYQAEFKQAFQLACEIHRETFEVFGPMLIEHLAKGKKKDKAESDADLYRYKKGKKGKKDGKK